MNRNKLIAKIHILKKELSLNKEEYQAVLYKITKKESCKELELYELKAVVKEFIALANKSNERVLNKSQFTFVKSNCSLMKKIFKQWKELGNLGALKDSTNKGLDSFLLQSHKLTAKQMNIKWVYEEEKIKAIEALKDWFAREAKKRAS